VWAGRGDSVRIAPAKHTQSAHLLSFPWERVGRGMYVSFADWNVAIGCSGGARLSRTAFLVHFSRPWAVSSSSLCSSWSSPYHRWRGGRADCRQCSVRCYCCCLGVLFLRRTSIMIGQRRYHHHQLWIDGATKKPLSRLSRCPPNSIYLSMMDSSIIIIIFLSRQTVPCAGQAAGVSAQRW
jgi:hypothetical protein